MAKQTNGGTGPFGCLLLLVLITVLVLFLIHTAGLPKTTEKRLVSEALTPMATVFALGGLLLIAALFRR